VCTKHDVYSHLILYFRVYLGGAVLADIMKDKDSWWVTKQEWEEMGPRALDKMGVLGSTA
jgi:actin-related protein 2